MVNKDTLQGQCRLLFHFIDGINQDDYESFARLYG